MTRSRWSISFATLTLGAALATTPARAGQIEPLPPAPPPAAPAAPPATSPPPRPTRRRRASGLASKVLAKGKGHGAPGPARSRDGALHGLDHGRQDVRQLRAARRAGDVPAGRASSRAGAGPAAHDKGEKRRFWIPGELAYGDTPDRPARPPARWCSTSSCSTSCKWRRPPEAPADVGAAPKDAKKTASGLAYKILKHGKGKEHPTADSTVEVHYTGWTTDGKMFDSSVMRGKPATFPLNGVIKGWTEGVQLMVVGDKRASGSPATWPTATSRARPGAPAGTLVFDIELLSIK